MGTINITLGDATQLNLPLGRQMENDVTEVAFDFSDWKTTYGSGTLSLSVQRAGDEMPYPVTMTTSGTTATWEISDTDTATWTPPDSPSLWVRVDDPSIEWPEWVQPVGATDAYPMGAKVSHNDKHWISNLDANVYEPGVYGWDEVTE